MAKRKVLKGTKSITPKRPAKSTPSPVSITALAASRNVTRTVINRALEVGALPAELFPFDAHGSRYVKDSKAAGEALDRLLASPPKRGRPPEQGASQLPEELNFEDPETWPTTLEGLRIVREWWVARAAKRKDDLAAGELVRAEDVRREGFDTARLIRDHMQRWPEAVANDIAAELSIKNADPLRQSMTRWVDRALDHLADKLEEVERSEP